MPHSFTATRGQGHFNVYNYYYRSYYWGWGSRTSYYNDSLRASFDISRVTFGTVAVPEPGSLALLLIGMLALVGLRLKPKRVGQAAR